MKGAVKRNGTSLIGETSLKGGQSKEEFVRKGGGGMSPSLKKSKKPNLCRKYLGQVVEKKKKKKTGKRGDLIGVPSE